MLWRASLLSLVSFGVSSILLWSSSIYFFGLWPVDIDTGIFLRYRGVVVENDTSTRTITVALASSFPGITGNQNVRFSYDSHTNWTANTTFFSGETATRVRRGSSTHTVPNLLPGTYISVTRDPWKSGQLRAENIIYLRRLEQ